MGRRGRTGRRAAGDLELVQGAGATDLIGHYPRDISALDRAMRVTAVARLETDGLSLGPVEHQYYATVLAVTGRERSTLSAEERDALSKALRALGWRATEAALLCTPELPACLSVAVLRSYVRALNTEAVVLLERDILADPPQLPWIKVAVCDDFFGSLDDTDKKRAAWEQLQAARRILALTE